MNEARGMSSREPETEEQAGMQHPRLGDMFWDSTKAWESELTSEDASLCSCSTLLGNQRPCPAADLIGAYSACGCAKDLQQHNCTKE